MKKIQNTIIIIIFIFSFFVTGNNSFAEEVVPNNESLSCVLPQVLSVDGLSCVDQEPIVCTPPQILDEDGLACIDQLPENNDQEKTCPDNQELKDDICVDKEEVPEEEILNIVVSVDVPQSCSVLDTDGVEHVYDESPLNTYLGVCALSALLDNGEILGVGLSNAYPDMGLFVVSFDDVEVDPTSEYWALYYNGIYEMNHGIVDLVVKEGDTVSFKISNFDGVETGDSVEININSLIATDATESNDGSNNEEDDIDCPDNQELKDGICVNKEQVGGGSGSSVSSSNSDFSLDKALEFLYSLQDSDGSIGGDMYSDWALLGMSIMDNVDQSVIDKLSDFVISNEVDSDNVLDYTRKAMALMSVHINPYNETEENYIEKIVKEFDGEQIGDKDIFNDDIFAILVLSSAGYDEEDEIIQKLVSFVISKQNSNGSFGSVDITSAFIMAVQDLINLDGISSAVSRGEEYILNNQKEDGSFGNVYSTSWAVQALSIDGSFEDEVNKSIEFLKNSQIDDGSFVEGDITNKIWATSYALPAISKLSWGDILDNFDKVEIEEKQEDKSKEDLSISKTENTEILLPKIEQINEDKKEIVLNVPNQEPKKELKVSNDIKTEDKKEEPLKDESLLQASAYDALPEDNLTRGFWEGIFDVLKNLWGLLVRVFI